MSERPEDLGQSDLHTIQTKWCTFCAEIDDKKASDLRDNGSEERCGSKEESTAVNLKRTSLDRSGETKIMPYLSLHVPALLVVT